MERLRRPEPVLSTEDRYRLLAENASDIVYQTDSERKIEWISPSVTTILGFEADELVGGPAAALLSPNQNLEWVERNRQALDSGRDVTQELLLRAKDGDERWFAGRARPYVDAGVLRYVVGMHDIHEQVLARERLMHSEEMFRAAMMSASSGMALLDREGRIMEVNQALYSFLGRGAEELLGRTWEEFTKPGDYAREERQLEEMRTGLRETFRMTKKYLHGSGAPRVGDLSAAAVRNEDGEIRLFINQITDITEQSRARDRLVRLATIDTLTGLANHNHILNELEAILASLDPMERVAAVLMVDITDFKKINDSLGREAGDHVLRRLAGDLEKALPESARIGRFGGDEFLIVMPTVSGEEQVRGIADTIRDVVEEEIQMQGRRIVLTCCIGSALSHRDATAHTMMRDANAALAMSKRTALTQPGRSQSRIFDQALASNAIQRLLLEGQLRDALDRREFVVFYQPVHRLKTGERVGFEALVRWQHPVEGLVPPIKFLPVAEETGLIVRLGAQVLEDVCRDMREHPDAMGEVAVNVSQVQLADEGWLESFLGIVEASGVDPSRLIIEITETAVMATNRPIDQDLDRLRELGVEVAVDDFGTGYSSISLLSDLPVTHLKLDTKFVASLGGLGDPGHALAEGLAKLAESMGLEGIAEGIETPEQATYLRAMGWPFGQGYYFGRPQPLEHWLQQDAGSGTGGA